MYEVMYRNHSVFRIDIEGRQKGIVQICDEKYLPFDIWLDEGDDIDDRLNNIVNFNCWASDRVLNLDREFSKDILNYYGLSQRLTDAERAKIAIMTRCLSINDCYWIKKIDEDLTWEQVNLFDNSLENSVIELFLFGRTPTVTNTEIVSPDIATDGKAPKAWLRENDGFYLLKGDKNNSVCKEVEASKILTLLGFENVSYDYYMFKDSKVSKCKCFTSADINLVRAEWLAIWSENHSDGIAYYISKYREQFDKMNLADYLVGNSDEHSSNWGFLYNNNMEIIGMSPLMDFDHAFESSPNSQCLPTKFTGNITTQEAEAIEIVKKHPDWLDNNVDLSEFQYGSFVQERIDTLQNALGKCSDDFDGR